MELLELEPDVKDLELPVTELKLEFVFELVELACFVLDVLGLVLLEVEFIRRVEFDDLELVLCTSIVLLDVELLELLLETVDLELFHSVEEELLLDDVELLLV